MSHRVQVSTFARLHLGFFDLTAHAQRRYGSMGVAIQAYQTALSIEHQPEQSNTKLEDAWLNGIIQRQCSRYSELLPFKLVLEKQIPRHAGLGSGTQMALAIACAMDTLNGVEFDAKTTALYHQRGQRSGIGVYTFKQGGLVVDGGHLRQTHSKNVPPLIGRYSFPDAWQFILIEDLGHVGIHGETEKQAFKTLKPQSIENTQRLNYQLLMETLPALLEADFPTFSKGLGALQQYNAEYFAEAQGGLFASQKVASVLGYLTDLGYYGLGQTSWGPTGFVLMPNIEEANLCLKQLKQKFSASALGFTITAASQQGANIVSFV